VRGGERFGHNEKRIHAALEQVEGRRDIFGSPDF
jgi:hypothetical protein